MSLRRGSIFLKTICLLLVATFLAGQVYAADSVMSCVGAHLVSDDIAQGTPHDRTGTTKDDVAGDALPGAIGNGKPLIALLRGRNALPPKLCLSEVRLRAIRGKIYGAIHKAIRLTTENVGQIEEPELRGLAAQTVRNLISFDSHLSKELYPMNADRTGPEDYLVGSALDLFEMDEKAAIAVDFMDFLYQKYAADPAVAELRLAQYLFH